MEVAFGCFNVETKQSIRRCTKFCLSRPTAHQAQGLAPTIHIFWEAAFPSLCRKIRCRCRTRAAENTGCDGGRWSSGTGDRQKFRRHFHGQHTNHPYGERNDAPCEGRYFAFQSESRANQQINGKGGEKNSQMYQILKRILPPFLCCIQQAV